MIFVPVTSLGLSQVGHLTSSVGTSHQGRCWSVVPLDSAPGALIFGISLVVSREVFTSPRFMPVEASNTPSSLMDSLSVEQAATVMNRNANVKARHPDENDRNRYLKPFWKVVKSMVPRYVLLDERLLVVRNSHMSQGLNGHI